MTALKGIEGNRRGNAVRKDLGCSIETAIHQAVEEGFRVGCRVSIGHITGKIIAYNISRGGRYLGCRYPLVVATNFGIAKCHPAELQLI